jgi:hypothetical protein
MPGCFNEKDERHNWAILIKKRLDLTVFSEVWINEGVGNVKFFLKVFF